VLNFVDFYF